MPHQSADWFAMTRKKVADATPVCALVRNDTVVGAYSRLWVPLLHSKQGKSHNRHVARVPPRLNLPLWGRWPSASEVG